MKRVFFLILLALTLNLLESFIFSSVFASDSSEKGDYSEFEDTDFGLHL